MSAPAAKLGSLLALVLACAAMLAPGADPAAAETCANEARRLEQGALALPDCRAYELVTPGAVVNQNSRPARAASGGGGLTYWTNHPAPGASTSAFVYLARRGAEGWSYASVGPQNAGGARFEGVCEQNVFFAPDLRSNILEAGWFEVAEPARCKRPESIVPGEPEPYRNVFAHDVAGDSYRLVNVTEPGMTAANARFQDASDDLSHIVFGEEAQLTPDAPPGYDFYVWRDGVVRLLTVLPDGTPASGELVEATSHSNVFGTGFAPVTGAVAADGSSAFFYSGGALYVRQHPDQPQSALLGGVCTQPERACTIQVDASQGPGNSGGGVFWRATPDGATVFFTATSKLTPDATAVAGKPDLYRYDVGSGQLEDLTVAAGAAADVRGVSGIGADGETVYFVANGVLAPGATPGDCPGPAQTAGHCNLYALHGGALSFIGRLSSEERQIWGEAFGATSPLEKAGSWLANPSPSGRYLAFLSAESLTGYDNTDLKFQTRDREIFVYDAAANGGVGALSCASCPPGPAEDPTLVLRSADNYGSSGSSASWMTNAVLDDGSVFFSTASPLIADDVNELEDVYRYRSGELDLISPGNLHFRAAFLEASPEGTDIFFRTGQALVGRDRDQENLNIYVARVGGGFAEPGPAPAECEADACRPPLALPPTPLLPSPAGGQVQRKPKPKPCRRRKAAKRRRCHRRAGTQRHKHHRSRSEQGRTGR